MNITLLNKKTVSIRSLMQSDKTSLYNYLQNLSPESRSRFGPHSFDRTTIDNIFEKPDNDIFRFIATDESAHDTVAYMLIKKGMIEEDRQRYEQRNQTYPKDSTVTFAPSVADDWQSSGLGTAMLNFIENELKSKGIRHILLWGGVQASNTKAVHYYKKNGYQFISTFWHNDMENYDMVKALT